MNRRHAIAGMAAAAAAVPLLKGQGDEVTDWVGWWERSKTYTMAIAEAMPADGYDYVPFKNGEGDAGRSFGALMIHIGQAEGFYLGRLGKGNAPQVPTLAGAVATKGKGAPQDTSKAAVVKYLNEVMDWSIGVVKQLTPADLTRKFGQGKQEMTGLSLLLNAMVHTGHTRGYSDMYLRNKGVKPPTYVV
ncbi:MAG: DinB family protein [Bryobacteraceae bacterium]